MDCLTQTESHFVLDNDPALIPPLVAYLKDNVFRMSGSDETGLIQLTVALREALLNAIEHGNLELSSELREQDDSSYHRLGQARRGQKPYADRRVHVIRARPHARPLISFAMKGQDSTFLQYLIRPTR